MHPKHILVTNHAVFFTLTLNTYKRSNKTQWETLALNWQQVQTKHKTKDGRTKDNLRAVVSCPVLNKAKWFTKSEITAQENLKRQRVAGEIQCKGLLKKKTYLDDKMGNGTGSKMSRAWGAMKLAIIRNHLITQQRHRKEKSDQRCLAVTVIRCPSMRSHWILCPRKCQFYYNKPLLHIM